MSFQLFKVRGLQPSLLDRPETAQPVVPGYGRSRQQGYIISAFQIALQTLVQRVMGFTIPPPAMLL